MRYGPDIRRQAAALFAKGTSRADVARRLGIARSTSSAWRRLWERDALLAGPPRGRRPRLGGAQLAAVGRALLEPPAAHGLGGGEAWSLRSMALLIERQTGVRYHHRHVARLAHAMGWILPPLERHARRARFVQPVETPAGPLNLLVAPQRPENGGR